MILDPLTILVTLAGVFLITFMKEAFGSAFAIAGIQVSATSRPNRESNA